MTDLVERLRQFNVGNVPCLSKEAADEIERMRAELAETTQTLLDLLNPLHGELDRQTYDEKQKQNFDAPADAEYNVDITARMERDLTQAVCILENRLRGQVR